VPLGFGLSRKYPTRLHQKGWNHQAQFPSPLFSVCFSTSRDRQATTRSSIAFDDTSTGVATTVSTPTAPQPRPSRRTHGCDSSEDNSSVVRRRFCLYHPIVHAALGLSDACSLVLSFVSNPYYFELMTWATRPHYSSVVFFFVLDLPPFESFPLLHPQHPYCPIYALAVAHLDIVQVNILSWSPSRLTRSILQVVYKNPLLGLIRGGKSQPHSRGAITASSEGDNHSLIKGGQSQPHQSTLA
jgi:hypothetical protein